MSVDIIKFDKIFLFPVGKKQHGLFGQPGRYAKKFTVTVTPINLTKLVSSLDGIIPTYHPNWNNKIL